MIKSKNIKIYSSFEEQKDDELAAVLQMSMVDRIAFTVKLIKKVYNYKHSPTLKIKKLRFEITNLL